MAMFTTTAMFATVAAAAGPKPLVLRVQADKVLGRVSPYMRGAGIEDVNHELYGGIYSQMLFGESFEEPAGKADGISGSAPWKLTRTFGSDHGDQGLSWLPLHSGASFQGLTWLPLHHDDVAATAAGCTGCSVSTTDVFNGKAAQQVGAGCGIANYGLSAQGMAFEAGKEYEGYVYVKNVGKEPAELEFTLFKNVSAKISFSLTTLATTAATVPAGQNWTKLAFKLSPAAGTSCGMTANPRSSCHATPELGRMCVECTGGFGITVTKVRGVVLAGTSTAKWSTLTPPGCYRGLCCLTPPSSSPDPGAAVRVQTSTTPAAGGGGRGDTSLAMADGRSSLVSSWSDQVCRLTRIVRRQEHHLPA